MPLSFYGLMSCLGWLATGTLPVSHVSPLLGWRIWLWKGFRVWFMFCGVLLQLALTWEGDQEPARRGQAQS